MIINQKSFSFFNIPVYVILVDERESKIKIGTEERKIPKIKSAATMFFGDPRTIALVFNTIDKSNLFHEVYHAFFLLLGIISPGEKINVDSLADEIYAYSFDDFALKITDILEQFTSNKII